MPQDGSIGRNRRGRKEKPVVGSGPLPDFARDLRALRDRAGLCNSDIAKEAHYSDAVISKALNGKDRPTWVVTKAIVRVCQGNEDEWEERWKALQPSLAAPLDLIPVQPVPREGARRRVWARVWVWILPWCRRLKASVR
jgi:hypothetical protein